MATEDTPEENEKKRGALKTFAHMVAAVAIDRLFDGVFTPVFIALASVITTILILLRTGLLQLSNWPGLEWIVLIVVALLLGVAILIDAAVYLFFAIGHALAWGLSPIFKQAPPKTRISTACH